MNKYIKKPIEIEAIQWIGKNTKKVKDFCNSGDAWNCGQTNDKLEIYTLEGTMLASVGDYIIKGVNGEFYPCKPDIFEKTYNKTPTLEEVKKEWEELEYEWYETKEYLYLMKGEKLIFVDKNFKTYRCFDNEDYDSSSMEITFTEHQLLTKTFRALGWDNA